MTKKVSVGRIIASHLLDELNRTTDRKQFIIFVTNVVNKAIFTSTDGSPLAFVFSSLASLLSEQLGRALLVHGAGPAEFDAFRAHFISLTAPELDKYAELLTFEVSDEVADAIVKKYASAATASSSPENPTGVVH